MIVIQVPKVMSFSHNGKKNKLFFQNSITPIGFGVALFRCCFISSLKNMFEAYIMDFYCRLQEFR